ncbi:MAG: SH3 domain-containing protein [Bauldia sp.]
MPLVPLKRLASELDEDGPAPRRRPVLVARSRPAGGTEATPAEAHAQWENLATDFPDLIKAEVDLVEELENILRGDIDATDADLMRRPDPCDDEPGVDTPTALDTFLADPWDDEPAQAAAMTDPTAMRLGTWDNAEAMSGVPASADDEQQRFWRAAREGTTAGRIRDRRRRSVRSDVVVISGLVLLIAGVGAYSAFRDWTPNDATAAATPLVQADAVTAADATALAGAEGAVAAPAPTETVAPAAEAPATPAPAVEAAAPAPAVVDPFAAEPRTVAVVPIPADNIPPTAPAEPATPAADALRPATPPPAAAADRVDTTPQPIDLLTQTPLAEAPATPPEPAPAPAEPAAAAPAREPVAAAPAPAPAPTPAPAPVQAAAAPPTGGTVAVANTWVNMRAGASSGSPVVRVVSPGTAVTVVSCDGWCEVVVDGATGWIYQDFLRGNR